MKENKKIYCIACRLSCGQWGFSVTMKNDYDEIFLVCLDKQKKIIERVYKVPTKYINANGITIVQGFSKWEKFRVDEKPYIETYNNIKIEIQVDPKYKVGHSEFLKESERFGLTGYQYHQKLINEPKVIKII